MAVNVDAAYSRLCGEEEYTRRFNVLHLMAWILLLVDCVTGNRPRLGACKPNESRAELTAMRNHHANVNRPSALALIAAASVLALQAGTLRAGS